MFLNCLLPILLFAFGLASGPEEGTWELRFDRFIDDRPPLEGDAVHLDINASLAAFPRYFNELGIERIVLRFEAPPFQRRKLSILWSGGSQGIDRFSLAVDGIEAGLSREVNSAERPYAWQCDDFFITLGEGTGHAIEIRSLPDHPSEINFAGFCMASPESGDYRPLCYESIGTLERYEEALGEKGERISTEHLTVFSPYKERAAARDLAAFLEKAYVEMKTIFGTDTVFRFSVEHYPEGSERGWGGISGAGTIGYKIEALKRFAQYREGDVRGFAGYTEEMCHGFKDLFRCRGTYEALGVAVQEAVIRRLVKKRVADAYWDQRHEQWAETAAAYLEAGRKNPDPEKVPSNVLYTRILNHLFRQLEQEYGPQMWTDFFKTVRQMDYPLHRASEKERMGVYVKLFSTLFGRDMQGQFTALGIDIDADPPWGWETYQNK